MKSTTEIKKKINSPSDNVVGWWMFSLTWKLFWSNAKQDSMPGTGLGMMV